MKDFDDEQLAHMQLYGNQMAKNCKLIEGRKLLNYFLHSFNRNKDFEDVVLAINKYFTTNEN